ncbi:MAG: hypothetical protein WC691_09415 [Sulfuricurvum sp.]|jgi:hypothetical protein
MNLNNNCCNSDNLNEIKVLFHSNIDHLVLMQCPECQSHWLYRHHEPDWMNNLMLRENDYEAWYLRIDDEYLHHVEELNFDELKYCANYLYVSTAKHPVNFNLTPDK